MRQNISIFCINQELCMAAQQQHFCQEQLGHSVEDLLILHSLGEHPQSAHLI